MAELITPSRLSAEHRLLDEITGHCDAWVAVQYAQMLAAARARPAMRRKVSLEEMGAYCEPTDAEAFARLRRARLR